MSYELDQNAAKAADNINSSISQSGKYVGTITRAEYLKSDKGTKGLGLSFKTDTGQTADYLDIYTHKADGEPLMGNKTVQAVMACTMQRRLSDGKIQCEKWNKQERRRDLVTVNGAPELMGKRIGLLLQEEYSSHSETGAETRKLVIFGVFSAETEMTASEILERKTKPEKLARMVEALAARPVRDNRKRGGSRNPPPGVSQDADDPFGDMGDMQF